MQWFFQFCLYYYEYLHVLSLFYAPICIYICRNCIILMYFYYYIMYIFTLDFLLNVVYYFSKVIVLQQCSLLYVKERFILSDSTQRKDIDL